MATKKPSVTTRCVANNYAAAGERIVEFSAHGASGPVGGLISFRLADCGSLTVEVYRCSDAVRVLPPRREKEAAVLNTEAAFPLVVTASQRAALLKLIETEQHSGKSSAVSRHLEAVGQLLRSERSNPFRALVVEMLRWRRFFQDNGMTDRDYHDADGAGWMSRLDRVLRDLGAIGDEPAGKKTV